MEIVDSRFAVLLTIGIVEIIEGGGRNEQARGLGGGLEVEMGG